MHFSKLSAAIFKMFLLRLCAIGGQWKVTRWLLVFCWRCDWLCPLPRYCQRFCGKKKCFSPLRFTLSLLCKPSPGFSFSPLPTCSSDYMYPALLPSPDSLPGCRAASPSSGTWGRMASHVERRSGGGGTHREEGREALEWNAVIFLSLVQDEGCWIHAGGFCFSDKYMCTHAHFYSFPQKKKLFQVLECSFVPPWLIQDQTHTRKRKPLKHNLLLLLPAFPPPLFFLMWGHEWLTGHSWRGRHPPTSPSPATTHTQLCLLPLWCALRPPCTCTLLRLPALIPAPPGSLPGFILKFPRQGQQAAQSNVIQHG